MTDRIPHIQIAPCTELIANCGACGVSNYTRTQRGDIQPNGVTLWDLRTSPNGFQTNIQKLCLSCIGKLSGQLGAVLEEAGPAALQNARRRSFVVDSQETDADPEHNVSPRRSP